jgi:hypothetical protein
MPYYYLSAIRAYLYSFPAARQKINYLIDIENAFEIDYSINFSNTIDI